MAEEQNEDRDVSPILSLDEALAFAAEELKGAGPGVEYLCRLDQLMWTSLQSDICRLEQALLDSDILTTKDIEGETLLHRRREVARQLRELRMSCLVLDKSLRELAARLRRR